MRTVRLGTQGLAVSAEGLGAMGMSVWYGARDEAEAIATLNHAVNLGVTFIDTAEAYGPFDNEELIGRALEHRRHAVTIATKFGSDFSEDGTAGPLDGSPEHVHRAIDRSLRHLGVDAVDLYYLHRVDPNVPIEETVGAMGELVAAGKVRYIGLSEAAPDTIRRAHATFPLSAVQSEYSLFERGVEHNGVRDVLTELGIGFVAFSPLGRGFLSGRIRTVDDLDADDARRHLPRFAQTNIDANLRLVDTLSELARSKGVTATQLALAWVMQQGAVPIPGTKRRSYLEENAAAADLTLSAADLARIDDIMPVGSVAGARDTEEGLSRTYK
jgi:aryl-alcohol dehydrogenase-like predicted oxidoreductase